VTPQAIRTTEFDIESLPLTDSISRPMVTHCCITLQDHFCASFPH